MRRVIWMAAACLAATTALGRAEAGTIAAYELGGLTGITQTLAGTSDYATASVMNMTRGAGLTGVSASNGFNSSGWNDLGANDYVQFGFTLAAGYQASVDTLAIATLASNTGPRSMNVTASVDGGAFTTLATLTVTTAGDYVDQIVSVGKTAFSSLVIRVVVNPADTLSATGGAIGSGGTLRLVDYYNGSYSPISLSGTVTPRTSPAVPEPASIALLAAVGPIGVVVRLRARRRAA